MNKGLGTATAGSILLAGLLFQVKPSDNHSPQESSAPATKPVSGDGPWLASCKYWSAAKLAEHAGKASAPDLNITVHETDATVESVTKASTSTEAACPGRDEWGVPWAEGNSTDPHTPKISAVIATVPDPIHSHLALDFDRAVDAILLAAADNHYLSSYYWLPWRARAAPSPSASESPSNPASNDDDNIRERQPGLIILRYAPHRFQPKGSSEPAYYRVVYVFLVGETPSLGVNGTQLQKAFQYEQMLTLHNPWLSPSPRQPSGLDQTTKTKLSIIGPFFSGSAASLHEGIEAAVRALGQGTSPSVNGVTSTTVAARELDPQSEHVYRSFGENANFEQESFLTSLACADYDLNRVAVLSEAGTVFGTATSYRSEVAQGRCTDSGAAHHDSTGTVLNLRFPRELSLLRNAQPGQSGPSSASNAPTPYLNFSLKDYSAGDTVPRFSTTQSPLSLEAQLMAIAHQLQRARSQFILISASNILDDIFLAQFLHRACPDARLVLFGGEDLLFERDGDNQPYIGSISISPYLLNSIDFGSKVQWLHSDYQAEAFYNAASYTFWDRSADPSPNLAGYRSYPVPPPDRPSTGSLWPAQFMQVPLWATVIGTDGYYPLAILRWCGSDQEEILPTIYLSGPNSKVERTCAETEATVAGDTTDHAKQNVWRYVPESINRNSGISPSLVWMLLDTLLLILCLLHIVLIWGAQFWSPLTRDLAVDQNDQPHRRSVYLNIGTSVLATMAFVTAYPLIRVGHYYHLAVPGHFLAWFTLIAAAVACLSTIIKTWAYHYHKCYPEYLFFNLVAGMALLFTIAFWIAICGTDNIGGHHSYAGLYFSYRCLQPLSGVCPLLPVLLLLLAWYLWSICQTARLRFSNVHRPRLARVTSSPTCYWPGYAAAPLFVPDDALERCERPTDYCLYRNITCLLITVEVVRRFCTNLANDSRKLVRVIASWTEKRLTVVLALVYLFLFALCTFGGHIHSLDRFLFTPIFASIVASISPRSVTYFVPTRYEFLITALFFPLIMIAFSGWLRAILIWGSLRRGLLEPLERLPLRFAFTRFKGGSWVSMLNQSGLHIRWRDMSRSTESVRQLVHHPYVQQDSSLKNQLSQVYEAINIEIRDLFESIQNAGRRLPDALTSAAQPPSNARSEVSESDRADSCLADTWDRPKAPANEDLNSIYSIEEGYAKFCGVLLDAVLIPYWDRIRTGLVEDSNSAVEDLAKSEEGRKGEKAAKTEEAEEGAKQCGQTFIHLAEELIVIRYVALIRAVLVNIRYLMLFVSAAFVLAIIAWNSYPFQPHRLIDWCFTFVFVSISVGFVIVFAQMHRDPILSRITDTTPNKLGTAFYIRIATFGAVPVLTWLAYQFPQIGGSLFRLLQPGLQVMK